jgi:AAA15 family ATPase/GTPase
MVKTIDILGLKNFRIFDDQNGFLEEFAAINILTGANNSGKSSIVKALQMIKNSVKGYNYPFNLDVNQQEHLLGDFNNILYNKSNKRIEISLPFLFFGVGNLYVSLSFVIQDTQTPYEANLRSIKVFDKRDKGILFSFKYRDATEAEKDAHKKEYEGKLEAYKKVDSELSKLPPKKAILENILNFPPSDNPLEAYIDWRINLEKLRFYLDNLRQFYQVYLNDKKNWSDEHLEKVDQIAEDKNFLFVPTTVLNLFNKDLGIEKWKDFTENKLAGRKEIVGKAEVGERDFDQDEVFYPRPEIEHNLFYKASEVLRRNLIWEDEIDESTRSVIEHCFRSSWDLMIKRISAINYVSNIKEENARGYNATSNSPFINLLKSYLASEVDTEFLEKYLEKFLIGNQLIVDYQPKYQLILVSIITLDGKRRELVDFGYGIKQIIQILIQVTVLSKQNRRMEQRYGYDGNDEIHTYYEPCLLIIEEPESNLHPKWQSLLADMLAEASKRFNIQVIIETHSEYLIRKFQTLVAKNAIKPQDVKIFYLRNLQNLTAGKKQVESLCIQENGSINFNLFDSGFFDESYNLNMSLLNIQFYKEFEDLKNAHQKGEVKIQETEARLQESEAKVEEGEAKIQEGKDKILEHEGTINTIQQKIDEWIAKVNINNYRQIITTRFPDHNKLDSLSVDYMVAGQYLLEIIEPNGDYSPVVLQYGRAVENELKRIFNAINATKKWMFGKMQGSLEKLMNGTTTFDTCNAAELIQLPIELTNMFNSYSNLRYDLVNDIRDIRNDASHAGHKKTKQDAIDYITMVGEFLDRWISEKK